MYTIGEFSKVTGLTVKALRFYHEEGLLVPAFVDSRSGYRHYDAAQVETARAIAYLRGLEFPVAEIKELLRHGEGDEPLLDAIERHKAAIEQKVRKLRKVARSLEQFIADERQARAIAEQSNGVQEKVVDAVLIGGIRMKGRYSDCGRAFAKLGRSLGRFIGGKPFLLHYDTEYKEEGADFEACFPLRSQSKAIDGVEVRGLPGGPCVTLLHKGPYEQLGHSYAKVFDHVKRNGYAVVLPTREVYVKGPGMIFKGNPKNYLTEIQIPVEAKGATADASGTA